MKVVRFFFGYGPTCDYVRVFNYSSAGYIASKIVKALNKNPNFPAIAYLDGDSICQKPLPKNMIITAEYE